MQPSPRSPIQLMQGGIQFALPPIRVRHLDKKKYPIQSNIKEQPISSRPAPSELETAVTDTANRSDSFPELCFRLLAKLSAMDSAKFVMTLWGIWRFRNDKPWNNANRPASITTHLALEYLCDWIAEKDAGSNYSIDFTVSVEHQRWSKPPVGYFKCNTDAVIFTDSRSVGFGVVVRDNHGSFCDWIYYNT
ncbi:hypothetical protein PTKIN_Ptkin04bG0243400 [Pterospermum kingtungense]